MQLLKQNTRWIALAILAFGISSCGKSGETTDTGINPEIISESNPHTSSGDSKMQDLPEMNWDKERHNFGKVNYLQKVKYNFSFTNEGDANLIISNAVASCGCTVPNWPKEPIAPGDKGTIEVVFNSTTKGTVNKSITVTANTVPNKHALTIIGEVLDTE